MKNCVECEGDLADICHPLIASDDWLGWCPLPPSLLWAQSKRTAFPHGREDRSPVKCKQEHLCSPANTSKTSAQEMCEEEPLSILALEVLFHARLLLTALVCLTYFLVETNIAT